METGWGTLVAVVGVLSLVVTKLVDTLRNSLDKDGKAPRAVWNVVAFGIGITVCLIWQVDIVTELIRRAGGGSGSATRLQGVTGQVLTGIGVGSGSAVWHDVLSLVSNKAREAKAAAAGVTPPPITPPPPGH